MFFNSTSNILFDLLFILAVAVEVFANPNNTLVIIIGGLLTGIYCTLAPALAQPFLRKLPAVMILPMVTPQHSELLRVH